MTALNAQDRPGSESEEGQAGHETVTPDMLMEHFRGQGFISISLFTIVVHAVLVLGFSVPYLMKTLRGNDTSKLSEKERLDIAVGEATESVRSIAQKHGLNPQDISGRFSGGSSRVSALPADASKPATPPTAPGASATPATPGAPGAPGAAPVEPEKPKSAIEKELDVKTKGPALPGTDDDKDGLFK